MAGKKLRPGKTGHTLRRKEPWTIKAIVDALFAFYDTNQRWPFHYEWLSANGLPSRWKLVRLVNPSYYGYLQLPQVRRIGDWSNFVAWRQPWDFFQRELAKDKRLTPEMVFRLPNVLARKEAIERIGFERLIKTFDGAYQIHMHPKFGTLYRLPAERPDESMHIIKVRNATREPDGSYAHYYLRVPPHIWDVQEAVAWTFNLDRFSSPEYRPLVET